MIHPMIPPWTVGVLSSLKEVPAGRGRVAGFQALSSFMLAVSAGLGFRV